MKMVNWRIIFIQLTVLLISVLWHIFFIFRLHFGLFFVSFVLPVVLLLRQLFFFWLALVVLEKVRTVELLHVVGFSVVSSVELVGLLNINI